MWLCRQGEKTKSFLISLLCLDWHQVFSWNESLGREYRSHSIREEGLLAQPPTLMWSIWAWGCDLKTGGGKGTEGPLAFGTSQVLPRSFPSAGSSNLPGMVRGQE